MSYTPPPPPPPYGSSPQYGGAPSMKPSTYLAWSIVTTIFCCIPFGIVAIVKSAKVDSLWGTGQYGAAQQASDDAKKWNIIGMVTALVLGIVYAVLVFGLGLAADSSYGY